ncbi:DUF7512 family protein [Halobaculum litoreum]|uniref:Uncharacterized protein n=1 Tax=Halobaculum litoreum TaxID=3031998 RepID=A0ABD5XWY2_9EURY|nr:hypothetical protein [Halobaculum sp. DT92]
MFGLESLDGNALAAALIGLVLAEAIVLYVGYGLLESALSERLSELIRGV